MDKRQLEIGKIAKLIDTYDSCACVNGGVFIAEHLVDNGIGTKDRFKVLYMGHFADVIVPINYKDKQ